MQGEMPRDARLRLFRFTLGVLVIALALGCDDDGDDDHRDAGRLVDSGGEVVPDAAPLPDGALPALSDAEIAGVVAAINAGEIAQAMLADDRAVRADVNTFAALMITDHTAFREEQNDLLTEIGVTPVETELSMTVETQDNVMSKKLAALSGAEFDAAYMNAQVLMHAEALDILQTRLMPSATNTRYRQYLIDLRDAMYAHLVMARAIDEEISGPVMP